MAANTSPEPGSSCTRPNVPTPATTAASGGRRHVLPAVSARRTLRQRHDVVRLRAGSARGIGNRSDAPAQIVGTRSAATCGAGRWRSCTRRSCSTRRAGSDASRCSTSSTEAASSSLSMYALRRSSDCFARRPCVRLRHAAPAFPLLAIPMRWINRLRARAKRDMTVPMGMAAPGDLLIGELLDLPQDQHLTILEGQCCDSAMQLLRIRLLDEKCFRRSLLLDHFQSRPLECRLVVRGHDRLGRFLAIRSSPCCGRWRAATRARLHCAPRRWRETPARMLPAAHPPRRRGRR